MKKIFTFLIILFFAISAGAQIGYQTIFDFEDGVGEAGVIFSSEL